MANRHHLPDLPALLSGQQRRRHRRPAGHPPAAGLCAEPECRRGLAVADLPLAHARLRLRRGRLHGDPSHVRHAGGLRRAADGCPRARYEADPRPGAQPHVGRARLVPGEPQQPRQSPSATGTSGATRRPTAARPTTGRASSAARPGPTTSRPASITCTSSSRSSRNSTIATLPCWRPCWARCASGSSAASTASASM